MAEELNLVLLLFFLTKTLCELEKVTKFFWVFIFLAMKRLNLMLSHRTKYYEVLSLGICLGDQVD